MTKYRRRSQLSDHGRLTVRQCGRFFQYLSVYIYIHVYLCDLFTSFYCISIYVLFINTHISYVCKYMGQTLATSMTGSMFSSSTFQLLHLNDFEVLRCHAATPKNILCFPVCLRKAACRWWWCPVIFPWFIYIPINIHELI